MTKEQKSIERANEICKADGKAIAEHFGESLSAAAIIKQLEDEDPIRKVTSIKIYRDEHGDESVLVGFKGRSNYESGVIYIKRPSRLQMLMYWINSLFRKKKSDRGIELYSEELEVLE